MKKYIEAIKNAYSTDDKEALSKAFSELNNHLASRFGYNDPIGLLTELGGKEGLPQGILSKLSALAEQDNDTLLALHLGRLMGYLDLSDEVSRRDDAKQAFRDLTEGGYNDTIFAGTILKAAHSQAGIKQADLYKVLESSEQYVLPVVERLIDLKLLEKVSYSDTENTYYRITDRGSSAITFH